MRKKNHVSLIRVKGVLILILIFASIFPILFVNFDDKRIQFTEENQILYKENLVTSYQRENIFKLIYGTEAGPTNLDPQNSLRPNSYNVINQVCEGLFANNLSDPNFSIVPNLATSKGSWIVNLTDTWYTVSLRPNISFHDGTKFNATAVKFTFDRLAYLINNSMTTLDYLYEYYDPDLGISYPIINKTVIIDEYTVRFELNKPYGPFETLLSFPGSYILSPTSTPQFSLIDTITGDLVGTGPFVYDHYIPDEEVLFHAFDDYWAGRANITILKFVINSDYVFDSYEETYEKTYNFTTQVEANDGTWDYWNTDKGYHSVATRDSTQYWCWTSWGTPSSYTGPPSGTACIYPETNSPTSIGDVYIATLADTEEIDAEIYGLYVTFNTIMRGDTAGHMYFEYWDGDSWEIKDDWPGDSKTSFTAQGPYDFTVLENDDFKIRFRVVVGGTIYQNDFTFDDVRIYGDLKASKVDVITNPPVSMFSTIISDPDVTLNDVGHGTTAQYLNMNNNKINTTFRKAISYAINYSYIINELQEDPSDRLKSPLLEDLLFANWSFDVATYNVTKAREYMQSMGFGVGWNTTFPGTSELNWSSASFASFNYSYYIEDTFRHSLLFTLQNNLDKIGIEITDGGMSSTEFNNILYQNGGYTWDMWELCWLGWYMDYNDPDNLINPLFTNRTTSFNTAFYNGYQAANESGRDPFKLWDNVQLLMEAALFETNQSIRKLYYDRIQQILIEEDMPWAFGIVSRNYDAFESYIIGFQSNPLGKLSFYGVTQNSSRVPPPIHLRSNQEWQYYRSANKCTGQGTSSDPYVIEDLAIDGKALENSILIENSDVYFTIENCTLYNGGIKLYNVSYGQLSNNNINNNNFIGINLLYSQYTNITRNDASNHIIDGIKLQYSDNNIIANNTADNNEYGINIWYSDNNLISENIVEHNTIDGIYLWYSNSNDIIGNYAENNKNNGMRFGMSNINTIEGNVIRYNEWRGIYLYYNSENNDILGNKVTNNLEDGIYLDYYCDNNDILGNNVSNNLGDGIYLYYSDYNNIEYNKVEYNDGDGIYLSSSDYNNILWNNVTNNDNGIDLRYSDRNIIEGNTISFHYYGIGIYTYNSYNNQISNNFFNGNFEDIKEVYYTYYYPEPSGFPGIIIAVIAIIVLAVISLCCCGAIKNKQRRVFPSYNRRTPRRVEIPYKIKKTPRQVEIPYQKESTFSRAIPPGKVKEIKLRSSPISKIEEESIKNCPYCEQKLNLEAVFCIKCGKNVEEDQVTPIQSEERPKITPDDQIIPPISELIKDTSSLQPVTDILPPKVEEVPSIPEVSEKKEEEVLSEVSQIKNEEIQRTPPISKKKDEEINSNDFIVNSFNFTYFIPKIKTEEIQPTPPISEKKVEKPKVRPQFCEFCGLELGKKATFCPQCGSRVKKK